MNQEVDGLTFNVNNSIKKRGRLIYKRRPCIWYALGVTLSGIHYSGKLTCNLEAYKPFWGYFKVVVEIHLYVRPRRHREVLQASHIEAGNDAMIHYGVVVRAAVDSPEHNILQREEYLPIILTNCLKTLEGDSACWRSPLHVWRVSAQYFFYIMFSFILKMSVHGSLDSVLQG